VIQRRRQQQDLVRVERPESLVHRRRTTWRLFALARLDLEQPLLIRPAGIIPHN
jgi:hypothetical protein